VTTSLSPASRRAGANPLRPPSEPIALDAAALKGALDAKAILLVFSDFECPFVGDSHTIFFPILIHVT
jgi:hypothetical protein